MKSEIPHNAMEAAIPWIVGTATAIVFAIIGFLFNRYIKSIDEKFTAMVKGFEKSSEAFEKINQTIDNLERMMNEVVNAQSKHDYRIMITEQDVKELIKDQKKNTQDIALMKAFHKQHHKDDNFNH